MPETKTLQALPPLPRAPRASKPASNPCACGCGHLTKSTFVPGHDSRLRGWVVRVERGVVALADIPDGEREAVQREMARKAAKAAAQVQAAMDAEQAQATQEPVEPVAEEPVAETV